MGCGLSVVQLESANHIKGANRSVERRYLRLGMGIRLSDSNK